MSCRQAFDVDLAGFLDEPRAPRFDAFRSHYPRCAECSAELRAWTELHERLRGQQHPSPETLAGYADLPDPERASIARHTQGCPACREELRLLAAFDPAALAQPAAPQRAASASPGWMEALARLLWHPAFAYGLAILLVVPVLWRTQGPGRFADAMDASEFSASAPAERAATGDLHPGAPPPVPDAALAPRAAQDAGADTTPIAVESFAAQSVPPATPPPQHDVPAKGLAKSRAAEPTARFERADAEAAAPLPRVAAVVPAPDRDPTRAIAPSAAGESDLAVESRATLRAAGKRATTDEFAQALEEEGAAAAEAPTLAGAEANALQRMGAASRAAALPAARLATVALATAPERVSLRVPVAAGARRDVDVLLSDAVGLRSLQQVAQASPDQTAVEIEVPRAWLAPGEFRVEVRDGAGPARVFGLAVVAR